MTLLIPLLALAVLFIVQLCRAIGSYGRALERDESEGATARPRPRLVVDNIRSVP